MARVVLLLLAITSVAFALREMENVEGWTFDRYVKHFGKTYNAEEIDFRRTLFQSRLALIKEHNEGKHSWKMGINKFTDMTEAEMARFRGYKKNERSESPRKPVFNTPLTDLPPSVDWREIGVVSKVRDQGQCGSCWAHASAETIESHLALATGQLLSLSVQDLTSCALNPDHCGGTGGCSGSTCETAFAWVAEAGIALDADYPYTATTGTCDPTKKKVAKVGGYVKLGENSYSDLMTALATKGPIAISVDASKWSSYSSGIFTACENQPTIDINHAVQAVGYGFDNGIPYWIVRNSWSSSWGEDGYIRLYRWDDGSLAHCKIDNTPLDGDGCPGGPPVIAACGSCGIWYDNAYPTDATLL